MNGNWLFQSLVSTVLLVPAWLSVGFFGKNYGVRPDVFMVWYLAGQNCRGLYIHK